LASSTLLTHLAGLALSATGRLTVTRHTTTETEITLAAEATSPAPPWPRPGGWHRNPGPASPLRSKRRCTTSTPDPPQRYLDPVSLGALIVSTATLAWTIYTDLRTKTPHPSPQVIARRIRIELHDPTPIETTERDHIIDVAVTETIHAIDD
jgi:hypothetical protein